MIPSQAALLSCVRSGAPGRVQTVNLQHLQLAQDHPEFRDALWAADSITADGWPVVALLRRLGHSVSRATGSQLVRDLVAGATPHGQRLALYGGKPRVGAAFAVRAAGGGHLVALSEHGAHDDWDADREVARCRARGVDLVLVAVSQPHGEVFAHRLRRAGLDCPVVGVGGAVDMVVGEQCGAPLWTQRLGLEWTYRLLGDPRRLARRYLVEGLPFFARRVLPALIAKP